MCELCARGGSYLPCRYTFCCKIFPSLGLSSLVILRRFSRSLSRYIGFGLVLTCIHFTPKKRQVKCLLENSHEPILATAARPDTRRKAGVRGACAGRASRLSTLAAHDPQRIRKPHADTGSAQLTRRLILVHFNHFARSRAWRLGHKGATTAPSNGQRFFLFLPQVAWGMAQVMTELCGASKDAPVPLSGPPTCTALSPRLGGWGGGT